MKEDEQVGELGTTCSGNNQAQACESISKNANNYTKEDGVYGPIKISLQTNYHSDVGANKFPEPFNYAKKA